MLFRSVSPLCAMVVALVIWAWKSKERTQERLEEALTNHIHNDEDVHDKLFTESRRMDKKLTRVETRQTDCKNCP